MGELIQRTASNQLTTNLLPPQLTSRLDNNDIDWDGRYTFWEDGSVNISESSKKVGSVNCSMRAVPVVSDEQKAYLFKSLTAIEEIMLPPTTKKFAELITELAQQCGLQDRSEAAITVLIHSLYKDLCDYPASVIEIACRDWRLSEEPHTKFMPCSGELKALLKENDYRLRKWHKRIKKLLGVETTEQDGAASRRAISQPLNEILARFDHGN